MPYGKDFFIFGHHYGDYLALTWRLLQNISWEKRMAFRQTYIITYGNVRSHGIPLIFAWPTAKQEFTLLAKSAQYPNCGHNLCNHGATSKL